MAELALLLGVTVVVGSASGGEGRPPLVKTAVIVEEGARVGKPSLGVLKRPAVFFLLLDWMSPEAPEGMALISRRSGWTFGGEAFPPFGLCFEKSSIDGGRLVYDFPSLVTAF